MIPRLLIQASVRSSSMVESANVIASHTGTNPETGRRMISGEMDVVLVPQGTLIEQIAVAELDLVIFSPQLVSAPS